jgi:RND family efflux transporter MFP subunit
MSVIFNRVILLCLAGLACALATGCTEHKQAGAGDPPPAMGVNIQVAQLQNVGQYTEYLATMKSRNASVLQPQVEGQITRIFVRSGDQVQPGQALLEIDPLKQQATVNNQQATQRARLANLELARKELGRRKQLYAAGVISLADLDQAQMLFDAAQADVDAMEAGVREQSVQLHYYTVRAPSAGTVGDIPVRVGDRVTNQTVLTTVDRGGELEAYISIPAEKSGSVRPGTEVEFMDDRTGKPVARSAISFISPRVDPNTQLLLLKAIVPNHDHSLRNEQVVHVRLVWEKVDRPLIPVTAVSRVGGRSFAFVAEDSNGQTVARQRPVTLGEITGNSYVVLDGIKPGERIIVSGVQMLADGMPIRPQS